MHKIKLYNKISQSGLDYFEEGFIYGEEVEQEDGIIVRSAKLHDIPLHDQLKGIARAGAGVNNIPIQKCSEKGIVVFNTPGANANAVKELVIAGMLMSARPTIDAISWLDQLKVREGLSELVEKEKSNYKGVEIAGKTLGIIGLGAIGCRLANSALALGMDVIGYDPHISVNSAFQLSKEVKYTKSLDELLKQCDFISLHLPVNEETKHLIDVVALAKMKTNVVLLNFSRGELVDEDALLHALKEKKVRKYVTDFPTLRTIHCPQCINLPHIGASTAESEDTCAKMAVSQLKEFLENGNIVNAVNLPNMSLPRTEGMRISCFHKNVKNMIAQISNVISKEGINIENLINKSKGDFAYTIVDVDADNLDVIAQQLSKIPEILKVNIYK